MMSLDDRLEFAINLAWKAGELSQQWFLTDLQPEYKGDESPVTIADRSVEEFLRREICAAWADDGVLGEEFGEESGSSAYTWILDPIDGTYSFINGIPLYSTLIGICKDDQPEFGVACFPGLNEIYYGDSQKAWHQKKGQSPRMIRASQCTSLKDSRFFCTSPEYFEMEKVRDIFDRFQRSTASFRGIPDALAFMIVAAGGGDVCVEPYVHPWDLAAIMPIAKGAGAVFCDFEGKESIHSRTAVVCAPGIKDKVLELIRG